jgi:hypothetical protein
VDVFVCTSIARELRDPIEDPKIDNPLRHAQALFTVRTFMIDVTSNPTNPNEARCLLDVFMLQTTLACSLQDHPSRKGKGFYFLPVHSPQPHQE